MISAGQKAGPSGAVGDRTPDPKLEELATVMAERMKEQVDAMKDNGMFPTGDLYTDKEGRPMREFTLTPAGYNLFKPYIFDRLNDVTCRQDVPTSPKGEVMWRCEMPAGRLGGDGVTAGTHKPSETETTATNPAPAEAEMGWWTHAYHAVDVVASLVPFWSAATAISDYKKEADQPGVMETKDHVYHVADIALGCASCFPPVAIVGIGWSAVTAVRDWYVEASDDDGKSSDTADAPAASASASGPLPPGTASAIASESAGAPTPPATYRGRPINPQSLVILVSGENGNEAVDEGYLNAQLSAQGWFTSQDEDVQKKVLDYAKEHALAHGDKGQNVVWSMIEFYGACCKHVQGFIANDGDRKKSNGKGPGIVYAESGKDHKKGEPVKDENKKEKNNVGTEIAKPAAPAGGGKGNGAAPAKKGGRRFSFKKN